MCLVETKHHFLDVCIMLVGIQVKAAPPKSLEPNIKAKYDWGKYATNKNWYLDQLSATGSNRKSIHTENEPPWSILTWSMSIGHDCCPGPFNVDQEPRDTDSFPKRLWDSCSTKYEIYVRKYSLRGHHASTLKGQTLKILYGIAVCVQHWRGRSHKHRRETQTDFKLILTRVGRAPF